MVSSLTESMKSKLPLPTTLDAAFRHHLEICGPVARKTILELAQFAPTPEASTTLLELGQNRDRYEKLVATTHITFARLLQLASPTKQWTALPLPFVIEALLSLQPRYYSISSSSIISSRRVAITALVVNKQLPSPSAETVYGLASNYILSVSNLATTTTGRTKLSAHGSARRYGGCECPRPYTEIEVQVANHFVDTAHTRLRRHRVRSVPCLPPGTREAACYRQARWYYHVVFWLS